MQEANAGSVLSVVESAYDFDEAVTAVFSRYFCSLKNTDGLVLSWRRHRLPFLLNKQLFYKTFKPCKLLQLLVFPDFCNVLIQQGIIAPLIAILTDPKSAIAGCFVPGSTVLYIMYLGLRTLNNFAVLNHSGLHVRG